MNTLEAPVLSQLLDPLAEAFTPEVARKVVKLRFSPKSQARIERLARKCSRGALTDAERREYATYVHTIDFIAVLQAKARAQLKRRADEP